MEPFEFVILGALCGFLALKAKPVVKATAKGYFAVRDKLRGTGDDFLAAIEEIKTERDREFDEELKHDEELLEGDQNFGAEFDSEGNPVQTRSAKDGN